MSTKSTNELLTEVEECWQSVRTEIDGVDLTTPVYPDPLWRVRDVLIHCAFWNDEAVKAIDAHLKDASYKTDTGAASFEEGLDAMNQRVVEASRSLSDTGVRARWMASQDSLTSAVLSLDDAIVPQKLTAPWHQQMSVGRMVADELDHEQNHIRDVKVAADDKGASR